jgi:hypothetical protein
MRRERVFAHRFAAHATQKRTSITDPFLEPCHERSELERESTLTETTPDFRVLILPEYN